MKVTIDSNTLDIDIHQLMEELQQALQGEKLKDIQFKGNNIRVTCPYHSNGKEKHPSCGIYCGEDNKEVEPGTFHCFTCGEKGPLYHFIALCFNCNDEEAKKWLLSRYKKSELKQQKLNLNPIILKEGNIKSKNTFDRESYLKTLQDWHPYMEYRKLTKEVCSLFEVKYDPVTEDIVFPVRDEVGNLKLITKRNIHSKRFLIEENIEKPVYLLYFLEKMGIKEAYVCESQINALTLHTHHLPGIALIGTGSKYQMDILNKSSIRVYHLMFDPDSAGEDATRRFIKNIRKDVMVDVIKLPKGKDVNDLSYDELEEILQKQLAI